MCIVVGITRMGRMLVFSTLTATTLVRIRIRTSVSAAVLYIRNFKRIALIGSMSENGPASPALCRNILFQASQLVSV